MNGSFFHPSPINALKVQARRLRAALESSDKPVTHSKSLELQAYQYGYKDWNTLRTIAGNDTPTCPVSLGAKVQGKYRGQPFKGEVIGVHALTSPDLFRVTLRFDEPVDVVTFGSFSNLRQRVSHIIDRSGKTKEKTSNGVPHIQLNV